MKADDTPRIAETVRLAGELLEAHGELAWELTRSWERGVRSASLQPNGSDRYELHIDTDGMFAAKVPTNDPTGEAVISEQGEDLTHRELQKALTRLAVDAATICRIIEAVVPPVPYTTTVEWCTNHLRIQLCEPVHRGDLCRFCYDFKNLRATVPPPSIMGLRHRYGRITEKQIDQALTADRKQADTLDRVNHAVQAGRRKAG